MSVVVTPLYGHTSEATAYVVADYPYGFRERTQIRYWLEKKAKKGWRFVSQTMNPKTQSWNKPKASTYIEWSAAMYLDGKGHVDWDGVGQYSDGKKILEFVRTFPGADPSVLRQVVPMKLRYLRGMISGQIVWKVNGVPQKTSDAELDEKRKELETWEEINVYLDQAKGGDVPAAHHLTKKSAPAKHRARIARSNARMPTAMRGVMSPIKKSAAVLQREINAALHGKRR